MTAQEFLKRLRTVKMCAHSFAQVLDLFLEYEKKYAEKRDKNAERMRTVRARVQAQQENSPYILTSSRPLKDSQKEKTVDAGARSKKRAKQPLLPMADDWAPTAHAREHLMEKGYDDAAIDEAAEGLRNWARSKAKTSTDWNLNLYNWMANPLNGGTNGHAQGANSNSRTYRPGERFVTSSGQVF